MISNNYFFINLFDKMMLSKGGNQMENVENKVIIITGATSGIGKATARVLANMALKLY